MKMMKNDDRKNEDFMFTEEVPESELYDKSNQSDIVYVESSERKTRVRILIVLAIILIILAIISALFGFMYLNKAKDDNGSSNVNITRYDIFVSHSDSSYGGNIVSFRNYNSKEKAFSYDFKVSNENPVDLNYKVEILYSNYTENQGSLNLISYSLLKNNEEIASGTLKETEKNVIADVMINANSSDDLVFKIWSGEIDKNIGFNFKVNVVA